MEPKNGSEGMINYIWGFMLLAGIIVGLMSGQAADTNVALLDGAKEAVSLCITMVGIMAFWTGLMEIAKQAGIIRFLTRKLEGILCVLFPDLPKEHPAKEYIASNMLANVLGLGWAATPMGLKAMEELAKINQERNGGKNTGIASVDMCTFLIINVSSLQLIPVNVIAYRSQYGSVNPASIVAPAIVATFFSTLGGVLFSVIARKICKKKN